MEKTCIFKNSRLVLQEIISGDDDWANLDFLKDNDSDDEDEEDQEEKKANNEKTARDDFLEPHQRLEIVKITKCKMKAKDTLEFEFGLQNMQT